ncbi:MAG TPA: archease [Acidobacteria bacterium]|nr:archease [Acidobacteriota bacterium]
MIRGPVPWLEVEHTADAGFEVEAAGVESLFETAAAALFGMMADLSRVRIEGEPVTVRAEALDLPALLIAWLSELLSVAMSRGLVFGAFEVQQLASGWVVGRAWGEELDVERHRFRTEIKAVTHHDLLLEQRDGRWHGRVIVDL